MHKFIRAGECAMCPRIFTKRAAAFGQGLNVFDLCRNCQEHIDRADLHGLRLSSRLEAEGAHLGAC